MYVYYVTMTHNIVEVCIIVMAKRNQIYRVWNYELLFSLLTALV